MGNKSGFTLVEILVAIVILGILMGMAIVSVSYILSRSKNSFYVNLEDQLILAAKSYYSSHRTLLPQNIGQKRQISIETLIKNNYLKRGDVVDYGKAECNTPASYVSVIKSSKTDYIYSVYLKCPAYSIDEEKKIKDIKISISMPYVEDISTAKATINMSVDEELDRIASYQYTIYKNDQVVYTSNNISGDNQSKITKTVKLKKYVPGALKVVATVYDIYGNVKTDSKSESFYDEGLPECGSQSPSLDLKNNNQWINSFSSTKSRKVTIKCINSKTKCLSSSFSRTFSSDVDESYVTILGKNNEEVNCPVTVMIDTTKPVCGTKNHSTTWTNSNRTVSVKCSDATSGCKQASYSATYNDSNTKNKVVKTANITIKDKAGNSNSCSMNVYVDKQKPTCTVSGGSTSWTGGNRTVTINCNDGSGSGCKVSSFKDTVTTTTKTKTYTVEDNAGNTGTCTANIYVDKTAPTTPTGGNIGAVSGSNASASIKTAASGSKDSHSGFSHYLYLVTNSSSTPSKNDSRFTTSRAYTRACGKSYYAWAVAVDKVGNRSSVKSLGSTKDGANKYSNWSKCSKKCGGGTQTRTNSCALITTGKSQSCNTMSCCSSTTTKWSGKWGSCSKSCGTGTQTMTGTKYSTYDSSVSCGTTSKSQNCNTQSCCSWTYAGSWSSWGSCSKSCGTGTQSRYRYRYSKYNSQYCSTDWDSKKCNTQSCKPAKPTISNPTGGNWVNYNFALTVKTTTASSSIGYWQYKYAATNWITYQNSATNNFKTTNFSAERNELVYIRVCTSSGVCSDSASTYIRIDKTKPVYTSVAPYCGDPWGDGTRNFVRLYFSDILSGLGMRYAHSWDSRNNTYFPNANFGGVRNGLDTIGNRDTWIGFEHTICDVAGNCRSWNDSNVRFNC